MKKCDKARALSVAMGALGVIAALTTAAPPAQADPDLLVPQPPPLPLPEEQSISVQAAPASDPAPPAEVPHLASPENLPPGTTLDPQLGRAGSYLGDVWHALRAQEISGRDAILLLLTQRPLDANAVPTNGLPTGPQPPLPPEAPPPAPLPPEAPPPAPLPPEAPPQAPVPAELAPPPAPVPAELAPPPPAPPTP